IVTYARAASKFDACRRDTHKPGGTPGMLPVTFVHDLPPSRVTCTLPSSVPAQITLRSFGDSLSATIVPYVSAFEPAVMIFATSRCERSGEITSQLSPRLVRRNSTLPPR